MVAGEQAVPKPDTSRATPGCLLPGGIALAQAPASFSQSVKDFYTPNGAVTTALGDLNGDGKVDIAVSTGGIDLLFGSGDGTFKPAVALTGFNDIQAIAASDFNRDGTLDLVAAVGGLDSPINGEQILFGNGDGTFRITAISAC